ncbi:hypothetical protein QFC22_000965 [Naganishia vaughanmartiniae]|uniref:Uncharacterized protein n=1 Tax=Naganishia vaughanmartiniae TaxID=1424756 RepID=A0ACC2XJY5_9TREE|nr:hypothetical protein QFC22_000965 [Naganishia vaughanmartiniae]
MLIVPPPEGNYIHPAVASRDRGADQSIVLINNHDPNHLLEDQTSTTTPRSLDLQAYSALKQSLTALLPSQFINWPSAQPWDSPNLTPLHTRASTDQLVSPNESKKVLSRYVNLHGGTSAVGRDELNEDAAVEVERDNGVLLLNLRGIM